MSGKDYSTDALLVRLRELERENAELREMLGLGQPVRQCEAVPSMREADPARLAPTRQDPAMQALAQQESATQAPAKQDPAVQTITKFSPPELKIALFRINGRFLRLYISCRPKNLNLSASCTPAGTCWAIWFRPRKHRSPGRESGPSR